jgi:sirohydrochlorin ferrochelatase
MIVALIDNGSLEPAAHRTLRAVAAALSKRTGLAVEAVSWKHSDRIALPALDGAPAWTLAPFIRAHVARGTRDFLFVPFFISAQGAVGSALRTDLERLSAQLGGLSVVFTDGLAARGMLAPIVAARVRATMAAKKLFRPSVILVDHGGPSAASAALRDLIASDVHSLLGPEIASLTAASMEGAHGPLFADTLAALARDGRAAVAAPLFLSPGRHAGPDGDLARIARASLPAIHFTDLVGTHPLAVDALAAALHESLASTAPSSA